MKKLLITLLVVIFTLSAASMAFAAEKPNPYSDVPTGHWAYQAVTDLYKSGVMEGWDDKFHGQSTLTRYEIAAITARAMAKADKADAATKAQIEKLSKEFSSELESLGVRVAALEKKADNVTITGEVRARYINQKRDIKSEPVEPEYRGERSSKHQLTDITQDMRARIHASGQINDTWKYWARFEGTEDFRNSGADADVALTGGYIEGTFNKVSATLGRFDYIPVNGMVFDETLDGAKLSYAEGHWQTNLVYGRTAHTNAFGTLGQYLEDELDIDPTQATFEVRYKVDDNLSLAAAYHQFNIKTNSFGLYNDYKFDEDFKATEIGFTYKLDKDWALNGSYSKTKLPGKVENAIEGTEVGLSKGDLDSAYLIGVSYKGADPKVEGSWGVYANYRNMQPLSTWASTYDSTNILTPYLGLPTGFKGYEVGFDYAPYKNTKLKMYYIDGKPTVDLAKDLLGLDQKYYRAQLEVFF